MRTRFGPRSSRTVVVLSAKTCHYPLWAVARRVSPYSAEVARPYPFAYGFVLDTRSGDGDCVDCFVVTDQALHTGDVVDCVPVHLLEQVEDGEVDHKVLCVLAGVPPVVAESAVATIRAFVTAVFSHIPGKRMELGRLHGPAEAVSYVQACRV